MAETNYADSTEWIMEAVALYPYEPDEEDELELEEGDVLRVTEMQDDGWWIGYLVDDPRAQGLFPSNYVKKLSGKQQPSTTASPTMKRTTSSKSFGNENTSSAGQATTTARRSYENRLAAVEERPGSEDSNYAHESPIDDEDRLERSHSQSRIGSNTQLEASMRKEEQQKVARVDREMSVQDKCEKRTSPSKNTQGYPTEQLKQKRTRENSRSPTKASLANKAEIMQERRLQEQRKQESAAANAICRWVLQKTCEAKDRNRQRNRRRHVQRREDAAIRIQHWFEAQRVRQYWKAWRQQERERARKQALEEKRLAREKEERRRQQEEMKRQQEEKRRQEEEKKVEQEERRRQRELEKRAQEERRRQQEKEERELARANERDDSKQRQLLRQESVEVVKTIVAQELDSKFQDQEKKIVELHRLMSSMHTLMDKQSKVLEKAFTVSPQGQISTQVSNPPSPHRKPEPPRTIATKAGPNVVRTGFKRPGSSRPTTGKLPILPATVKPVRPLKPSGIKPPRAGIYSSKLPQLSNKTSPDKSTSQKRSKTIERRY